MALKDGERFKKYIWMAVIIIGLFLGYMVFIGNNDIGVGRGSIEDFEVPEGFTDDGEEILFLDDGTRYTLHPDNIRRGIARPGDIKDVIPSIDNPKFVTMEEADEWIEDNELVLALVYNGVERVYPLQILVWHEIVNDVIDGEPILITYCPLCGSGISYEGSIQEQRVEFGTSGKLYNSNLIMYDRNTETYWTQIDGKAVIGPLTGLELKEISIDTVVWRDWKGEHKDSEVLSQDTGHSRNYGNDPYGNYYEDSFLIFPVDEEDNRIHPKTVVFGVEIGGKYKAYQEDDLIDAGGVIEDEFAGAKLKILRGNDGIVKITNLDTGEEIVKERDFWFAWYAFHPETELYV